MADIGTTLRETRIRDKIDITAVEQATKIRAKYLRALENEEWAVLPGPTYVKSFLRTYAEFLGLDAHMIVEEYRARYERPEELEVPAFARERPIRGRVRPPGPPSRATTIAALVAVVLVILFVLGITGDDDGGDDTGSGTGTGTQSASQRDRTTPAANEPAAGKPERRAGPVRVQVVAARPVWVCLVDARDRPLVGGRTLAAGEREGPFRSRRFRITIGNGGGDLLVNGKRRDVPEASEPVGYAIAQSGLRRLTEARRPTCEAGAAG
jgi:Helix-turn-helix domain